jgi:hypothetical protein
MFAALIWIAYGTLVGARPVIVANFLVLGAAAVAMWKENAAHQQNATVLEN